MFLGTVLMAAGGDWTSLIVPLVFVIIYVVNHLLSLSKPKPNSPPKSNNPQRQPGQGERPPRPPRAAGQPPANPSPLNAEIEQFLKRAQGRPGDRTLRAPTAKAPPLPPPREEPVDVQPIERSSVASSVEKHMANRGFGQRAEHLADDVVRGDQEMEQHLQKAFSHRVGTLSDSTSNLATTSVTEVEPVASQARQTLVSNALAGLLADPQSLKQAVILTEILQRPEHRW